MEIELPYTAAPTDRITRPYVVVDSGRLRDRVSIERLLDRARGFDELILIPDSVLLEITKERKNWETNFRRDLEVFTLYPAGVAVSRSVGELLREEKETGRPFDSIVSEPVTYMFRRLLDEIRMGDGRMFDRLRAHLPKIRTTAHSKRYDHVKNQEQVELLCRTWEGLLQPTELSTLRQLTVQKDFDAIRPQLAGPQLAEVARLTAEWQDIAPDDAVSLAGEQSMWAHYIIGQIGLGLHWAGQCLPMERPGRKFTNDLLDLEHALIASFCRGYLTSDQLSQKIYEDIRTAADLRWRFLCLHDVNDSGAQLQLVPQETAE